MPEVSYKLLLREAKRRGVEPDALADELLRADLSPRSDDLAGVLTRMRNVRVGLPEIDGIALARGARDDLGRRSA